MRRFLTFGLISVALLCCRSTTFAQDKAFQDAVLQKLNDLEKRLDEMDKRYEIRFARIEERFNTVDERFNRIQDKIEAVNVRIDDKFNLMIGLLGLFAALLALPYVPKLFERFRSPPQAREDIARLEKQIEQIQKQLMQLSQSIQPTP
jgi:septal ring factor EnvC (AmiA/AmiB activator)